MFPTVSLSEPNKSHQSNDSSQSTKIAIVANFDLDNLTEDSYKEQMGLIGSVLDVDELLLTCRRTILPASVFESESDSVTSTGSGSRPGSGIPSRSRTVFGDIVDVKDAYFFISYSSEGNIAFPLFSKETMGLNAVKVGSLFIVLEKEQEFLPVKKHLMEKEGAAEESFLYYTMPKGANLDLIWYGITELAYDIPQLYTINTDNIKDFNHHYMFVRILGFFLIPAVLRRWYEMVVAVVRENQSVCPDQELVDMWCKWNNMSSFIYSQGKTKSPIDGMTLQEAENAVMIVQCKTPLPKPKYDGNWVPPKDVEPFVNKVKARQAAKWRLMYGGMDVGKDGVIAREYHSRAGVVFSGHGSVKMDLVRLSTIPDVVRAGGDVIGKVVLPPVHIQADVLARARAVSAPLVQAVPARPAVGLFRSAAATGLFVVAATLLKRFVK